MSSVPEPVLHEVKETFGRVAYTHKTHEKDAERADAASRRMKVANLAVIGVTAAAALTAPLLGSAVAAWIAVLSALVALVFATLQLSFDPAASATKHRLAAKAYLALRNDYRRLLADAQSDGLTLGSFKQQRDSLARELGHLDDTAPQTSPRAYETARDALRGSEELTFTQDEYRHLLAGGDS
jgi:hypothetical protein